ncbi:hypothetical protein EO244_12715 [Ancylomarina salipaludis]|uniref:Uncharacterized protein n=1 Tax=Ancylomarina salipaludis TaxID=2501299 RepID=A0A4Q1JJN8_9BACT|nr:hypothetical protein [Ancylomarina salipaludis]RXQ90960.1 hypothetical protein EO244_12715 [Ancylomarina salipaludis]
MFEKLLVLEKYKIMKQKFSYLLIIVFFSLCLISCEKEDDILPTEDIAIEQLFKPSVDAHPMEVALYDKYNVWVRTTFEKETDVTNSPLYKDIGLKTIVAVDDEYIESAYKYYSTLLENLPPSFCKLYLPSEIFLVKEASGYYGVQLNVNIGRSRFVSMWPNSSPRVPWISREEIDLEDYDDHYYKDKDLASDVWSKLVDISGQLLDHSMDIENAGWPYSKTYREEYFKLPWSERGPLRKKIEDEGGFISWSGSLSFETDIAGWMKLIILNSYDTIKSQHLDKSEAKTKKYKAVIKYFNDLGWDIQATGNKYEELNNLHGNN